MALLIFMAAVGVQLWAVAQSQRVAAGERLRYQVATAGALLAAGLINAIVDLGRLHFAWIALATAALLQLVRIWWTWRTRPASGGEAGAADSPTLG